MTAGIINCWGMNAICHNSSLEDNDHSMSNVAAESGVVQEAGLIRRYFLGADAASL